MSVSKNRQRGIGHVLFYGAAAAELRHNIGGHPPSVLSVKYCGVLWPD